MCGPGGAKKIPRAFQTRGVPDVPSDDILIVDIHVEIDSCRRRCMMAIIPVARMVVIVMIIMRLVATRQREGDQSQKENRCSYLFYCM